MKLSSVILGGDTGMLHLAVALKKRVLMLIGALDPGRSFPFQHPEWTITPAKGQPVSSISAEAVTAACARAFEELGLAFSTANGRE